MSELVNSKPTLSCGFCRRGTEVKEVCGKLWNDVERACTAHQRCMQYSAGLTQYTMKRFGGFKVSRVLKELHRGKRLKCSICKSKVVKKRTPAFGAATAGCAWGKCRKTFHFYCARKSSSATACKMVEMHDSGEKIDHYCVFCCDDHSTLFKKNLKNPVHQAPDTDDEAYKTEVNSSSSSSESDESVNSSSRDSKKTNIHSSSRRRSLECRSGDSSESDNEINEDNDVLHKVRACTKLEPDTNVLLDLKRRPTVTKSKVIKKPKLESELSDAVCSKELSDYVICFVERADRVNEPMKEGLEREACTKFNVPPSSVYVWQYNGRQLSSEHFIYLLNDISKALAVQDNATLCRLVFKLELSDIARFDKKIAHNSILDENARRALYNGIRQQVIRNFKTATNQSKKCVCGYWRINKGCDGFEEVAFVLISSELIKLLSCNSRSDVRNESDSDAHCNKSSESNRKVGKGIGRKNCRLVDSKIEAENKNSLIKVSDRRYGAEGRNTNEAEDVRSARTKNDTEQINGRECGENSTISAVENVYQKNDVVIDNVLPLANKCSDADTTEFQQSLVLESNRPAIVGKFDEDIAQNFLISAEKTRNSLYVWDYKTILSSESRKNGNCSIEEHRQTDTEYKLIKEFLIARLDALTSLCRYPVDTDVEFLSPNTMTVTRRLANYFMPNLSKSGTSVTSEPGANHESCGITVTREFEMARDEKPKAASSIVFIGPFDTTVIRHDEYVRKRLAEVLYSWSTSGNGYVCCVMDVGPGVMLSQVTDVIGASGLPFDVTCLALTGVEPLREPVSCAIFIFSKKELSGSSNM